MIDKRVSPRAALFLAKPEHYGLKLLYAEGFRNPSAFEGAFYDKTTFQANPDIGSERIRSLGDAIKHMLANVTAVVLEIINFILRLHSDAPIAGIGIILSAIVVLILLYSGWKGGDLVFRHGIGVDDAV